jgi:hypothetical protein
MSVKKFHYTLKRECDFYINDDGLACDLVPFFRDFRWRFSTQNPGLS